MTPSFVMIDDFAADPHELRRQALGLGYETRDRDANYPGVVSARALPIKGLDDYVSRIVGRPVVGAPGTLHGHCRLTLKGDRGRSGFISTPLSTRVSSTSACPNIAAAAPISTATAVPGSSGCPPRSMAWSLLAIRPATRWWRT